MKHAGQITRIVIFMNSSTREDPFLSINFTWNYKRSNLQLVCKMKKLYIFLLVYFLIHFISAQTTIHFSGITWDVRNGSGGPGPNSWSDSPNNVWVDAEGQLHLKIRKEAGTWYSSEIYAQQSYGYGEYRFYVASNVEKYDPAIVTGLFTYETDTREIDIEFSRWGNPANEDGWYTVQPVIAGSQQNFALNLLNDSSTHTFTWESNSIFFQSYQGYQSTLPSTENLISEWNYTGNNIPPAGNERLHINFWLFGGHAPVNQQDAELVIKAVSVPGVTSVNETTVLKGMNVLPNPFYDKFTIEIHEYVLDGEIFMLNLSGQVILKQAITGRRAVIEPGKFPPGIYFVKIIHNKEVEIQKIIRE